MRLRSVGADRGAGRDAEAIAKSTRRPQLQSNGGRHAQAGDRRRGVGRRGSERRTGRRHAVEGAAGTTRTVLDRRLCRSRRRLPRLAGRSNRDVGNRDHQWRCGQSLRQLQRCRQRLQPLRLRRADGRNLIPLQPLCRPQLAGRAKLGGRRRSRRGLGRPENDPRRHAVPGGEARCRLSVHRKPLRHVPDQNHLGRQHPRPCRLSRRSRAAGVRDRRRRIAARRVDLHLQRRSGTGWSARLPERQLHCRCVCSRRHHRFANQAGLDRRRRDRGDAVVELVRARRISLCRLRNDRPHRCALMRRIVRSRLACRRRLL